MKFVLKSLALAALEEFLGSKGFKASSGSPNPIDDLPPGGATTLLLFFFPIPTKRCSAAIAQSHCTPVNTANQPVEILLAAGAGGPVDKVLECCEE